MLLLGRTLAQDCGLPCESAGKIIAATGASKSRAYEVADDLVALLPTLVKAPGRPGKEQPGEAPDKAAQVTREVLAYVMQHPGAVDRGAERQRYSDDFRRFVVELRGNHETLSVDAFADAAEVPLGTLKDWLRVLDGVNAPEAQDASLEPLGGPEAAGTASTSGTSDVESLRVQTVLEAWTRWSGSFVDFCKHVQRDLRVPYGRDLVRRILTVHGQRRASRRKGRTPDEHALRGAFRTWFPGAQWVGDGMQVSVIVDQQRFVFNLELNVDAHTDAFVGVSVRDGEDSDAVIEALASGVDTTGAAPLALLLDNKPSNHTAEVAAALGDTIRIRATPERPQNKAHVEGAFGLFSQVLPLLVLNTSATPRDLARGFLGIVAELWARTTNHRPRRDRGGRSRADLYADQPTTEQVEQAKRELREIAERQDRARLTLKARRRPEVLELLDHHFERLGLVDPERHFRITIAGYPRDAIIDAVYAFEAKKRAMTLPVGADARYLLGIVKNVAAKTEGEIFAELLYRGRLEAREFFLAPLRAEREALRAESDVMVVLRTCVEKATGIPAGLERTFWLDTIVETLRERASDERKRLYLHVARLIEATFAITPLERHDAVRYVADKLVPLK